jgi:hypothetical protein
MTPSPKPSFLIWPILHLVDLYPQEEGIATKTGSAKRINSFIIFKVASG